MKYLLPMLPPERSCPPRLHSPRALPWRKPHAAGRCDVRRRLLLVHGAALRQAAGRVSTTSGYIGGQKRNPLTRRSRRAGPATPRSCRWPMTRSKVSYEKLLEVYWRNVDPTVKDRQFCDVGSQYRSAIFYHSEEQKRLAETLEGRDREDEAVQSTDRHTDNGGR